MQTVSHQTISLGRGKHTSPEHGACVMELASMLAGEPFSDHPRTVSPAIGSFLRNFNDLLDDERRQDLYAYATKCVGTASTPETELARAEHLIRWGDARWAPPRTPVDRRSLPPSRRPGAPPGRAGARGALRDSRPRPDHRREPRGRARARRRARRHRLLGGSGLAPARVMSVERGWRGRPGERGYGHAHLTRAASGELRFAA